MTWRFDWITSWDEIWSESFVARWHEWIKASPTSHVFFHPALVRAWVDTYLPLRRIEPRFLIATQDDCTVFLPMVLWRRNWKNAFQRLLVPVGHSDYDYHDPIVVGEWGEECAKAFWKAFLQEARGRGTEYDALELNGLRGLETCIGGSAEESDVCPWCDLSGLSDGEVFLASVGRNLRKSLTRKERRLKELGEVSYHVFSLHSVSEAIASLEDFLLVHAARWPCAYKAPCFHRNLLSQGLPAGIVHFSTLKLAGKEIAWQLAFVDSLRFYAYVHAHRPEYALESPGQILLYYCVKAAIEKRLKVFDHLRGEESYKAGWANQVTRLYSLRTTGSSCGARIRNTWADQIKPALGRFVRRHGRPLQRE